MYLKCNLSIALNSILKLKIVKHDAIILLYEIGVQKQFVHFQMPNLRSKKQTVRYTLVVIIKCADVVKKLMLYIKDWFSWGLCKFLKGFVGIFSRLKLVWFFDFDVGFLKSPSEKHDMKKFFPHKSMHSFYI